LEKGVAIKAGIKKSLKEGTLCTNLQGFADQDQVASLITPPAMTAIKAFCDQNATFDTIFGGLTPTLAPTISKSKAPSSIKILSSIAAIPIDTVSKAEMNSMIGVIVGVAIFFIFGVWGCLRCLPCCVVAVAGKKERGHLYDILVIVDDHEELILKNIRHKDIAYFRNTKSRDSLITWDVNDANDVFETRFEVEFFDRYDLMGRGRDKFIDEDSVCNTDFERSDEKIEWRKNYTHQALLETGMIIRVNPAKAKCNTVEKELKYDQFFEDSESTSESISTALSTGSSAHKRKSSLFWPLGKSSGEKVHVRLNLSSLGNLSELKRRGTSSDVKPMSRHSIPFLNIKKMGSSDGSSGRTEAEMISFEDSLTLPLESEKESALSLIFNDNGYISDADEDLDLRYVFDHHSIFVYILQ
jgi:hypothetical protein